jgi:hypothetical protein
VSNGYESWYPTPSSLFAGIDPIASLPLPTAHPFLGSLAFSLSMIPSAATLLFS